MQGGDLDSNNVYKYILSIGYEFETHDLAKLSLTTDNVLEKNEKQGILVNSNNALRNMKEKVDIMEATKLDDHYYEIMDEDLFFHEYFDEPDTSSGKNKEDGKYNVIMHVTNDRGVTPFDDMLFETCSSLGDDVDKNDIYMFRTRDAKTYDINFTTEMKNARCSAFSGTEYVVTYYHPHKSNNVILETFLNACKHIFVHLDTLQRIPGQLCLKDGTKLGTVEERLLFHKPNTNMYYMQTHDDENNRDKYSINMVGLVPQMTFRTNIVHLIDVIKEMVLNTDYTIDKRNKMEVMKEHQCIVQVELCIKDLLTTYNSEVKDRGGRAIPLEGRLGKSLMGYFFMIFYKIYMYVDLFLNTDTTKDENYFKDYLGFASRHPNIDLYERIKEYLIIHCKSLIKNKTAAEQDQYAAELIRRIVHRPEIIQKYMFVKKKIQKALTKVIENPLDPNYGNPSISFLSYFLFFEKPGKKRSAKGTVEGGKKSVEEEEEEEEEEGEYKEREWFIANEVDIFTTTFALPKDGTILLENRIFFKEISVFAKTKCGISLSGYPTVAKLKKIYSCLIDSKHTKNLYAKEMNPATQRMVNKCLPGYVRNEKYACRVGDKTCKKGYTWNKQTRRCNKTQKKEKKKEKKNKTQKKIK